MSNTDLFVWAVVLHLIADWIFQNEWMARNKTTTGHPAMFVHGAVHLVFMSMVFPFTHAIIISGLHVLIDTRIPAKLWQKHFKQTAEGPYAIPVAIWLDQVFHVVIIALVSLVQ